MKKMKILFVCKHNVFRSRVAEEYFNKINKNKNIEATSMGIIMGGGPDREQIEIAQKLLGIEIIKRKPMALTIPAMLKADIIIVVANDIPKGLFTYQIYKVKDRV